MFLFFRYIPGSGIAGSYDSSIFSFLRNLYVLFSIVATAIYISTNSVLGFCSAHPHKPLLSMGFFFFFFFLMKTFFSDRGKEISHCRFDLHFSHVNSILFPFKIKEVENTYQCLNLVSCISVWYPQ